MKNNFEKFTPFIISQEKRKSIKGGYIQCSVTIAIGGGRSIDVGGPCASSSQQACGDYAASLGSMYTSMGYAVMATGCSQY